MAFGSLAITSTFPESKKDEGWMGKKGLFNNLCLHIIDQTWPHNRTGCKEGWEISLLVVSISMPNKIKRN